MGTATAGATLSAVTAVDDADVDDLLRLFVDKLRSDGEVLDLDLRPAAVVFVQDGTEHRLHLPRPVLAALLEDSGDDAGLWGPGVSARESAARFLCLHLDESLDTRQAHDSGWWSYARGGFDPLPPWEASRR